MSYDDTNSGAMFPNDFKDGENHPDYKGTINVEGKEYDLAGWSGTFEQDGEERPYVSLRVSEPYNGGNGGGGNSDELLEEPDQDLEDMDDDLPF